MKDFARREWFHWTILAAMFLTAALVWPWAPDRIPMHGNAQGQVDGNGGKFLGVLAVPLMSAGTYLFLLLLHRTVSDRAGQAAFSRVFFAIRLIHLVLFAVMYAVALLITFGFPISINLAALLGAAVMFIVLGTAGNLIGKLPPHSFCGHYRHTAKLASTMTRPKVLQAGGRVFLAMGLIGIIAAFLPAAWGVGLFEIALLVGVVSLAPYAYLTSRRDANRKPPAGQAES